MMLNYRKLSAIGFAAYICLTVAMDEDHAAATRIMRKLLHEGTEAGRFVAVNVVEAYSELHPAFAPEALQLILEDMLPRTLDDGDALPHLLVCAAGIVENDTETLWKSLVPQLDMAFAHLGKRGDAAEMHEFGSEMRCMAFSRDAEIGARFVMYLIEAGYLRPESPWRPAALEICAGMVARDRAKLARIFAQQRVPELTVSQAADLISKKVLQQQRAFGTRSRWNGFFVRQLGSNAKMRYLLMKHMFGSVALCNSVAEWATQMGTFMIEAIRAYADADEDPRKYAHLTVEDIERSTPMRPVRGGGVRYIPRRNLA
jgi:hypothetical protein